MTPAEEKAQEMIQKFRSAIYEGVLTTANMDMKREAYRDEQGKRFAIICVNEIIDSYSQYKGMYDQEFFDADIFYWQSVLIILKQVK